MCSSMAGSRRNGRRGRTRRRTRAPIGNGVCFRSNLPPAWPWTCCAAFSAWCMTPPILARQTRPHRRQYPNPAPTRISIGTTLTASAPARCSTKAVRWPSSWRAAGSSPTRSSTRSRRSAARKTWNGRAGARRLRPGRRVPANPSMRSTWSTCLKWCGKRRAANNAVLWPSTWPTSSSIRCRSRGKCPITRSKETCTARRRRRPRPYSTCTASSAKRPAPPPRPTCAT